jgi:hypothetical protein
MSFLETGGAVETRTADRFGRLPGAKVGEYVSIQGVPSMRIAKIRGEAIIQRSLRRASDALRRSV